MSNPVEQDFAKGVEFHQSGQLAQAESLYRRVLQAVPDHLDGLNLLGLVAVQTGRNNLAVEVIGKAIALNDKVADFHNNIGEAFRRLGELDRAADHFGRAVDLEPTFVEAQQNLGDVFRAQGKLDLALAIYARILAARPDFAITHASLGDVLRRQGRLEEAVAHLRRAATMTGSAEAHNELGIALREQGKLDDAIAQFRRALSRKEDFAEAHNNLGNALRERGQLELAAAQLNRAVELKPEFSAAIHNLALVQLACDRHERTLALAQRALELRESRETRALFVRCLKERPSLGAGSDLRPLLLRALFEPWGRPNELVNAVVCRLRADPATKTFIERVGGAGPGRLAGAALFDDPGFDAFAADELLQCLLTTALVADLQLERLFTELRTALLADVGAGRAASEAGIAFFCALARQCLINDYVYAQAEREREQVEALRGSLADALCAGAAIPASSVTTLACYVPLHSLPSAHLLLKRQWPAPVNELLRQQVREPAAARRHRASLPRLTAIEDVVSLAVRQQYEDNPYPSWAKLAPADEWPSIGEYVRNLFPLAQFERSGKPDSDILVAGCGTGQQSIETAQRFPHARLLAVDLSLASLGYARLKTDAAQVSNIDYAQADLLRLGTIDRTFDMIEVTGVLHHLSDPMRGWQVLLSLLRPRGFMRLGLYSRLARADVRATRAWIAERGYRGTPDDIRRCRREMMAWDKDAQFAQLILSPDFASTSACRDLLFHVHERQLTLVEIERFLSDQALDFLGFELDSQVLERYRTRFPDDAAMTRLDHWHAFETDNPRTFGGMYQFWIQKRS